MWGLMGCNAAETRMPSLQPLLQESGLNWPSILTAVEPYARWNVDQQNRDEVLSALEDILKPAPELPEPKKRAHKCVEHLDAVADMLKHGHRDMVEQLVELKGKHGEKLIGVYLDWEGTKMRVVMEDSHHAVRARADRLDRQIKGHKSAGLTKSFKEARTARNWKPSMRVVPLSPERAAECGMETT